MSPESLTMVATDGHRLAYVQAKAGETGSVSQNFRALVPKKAMSELIKLARADTPSPRAKRAKKRA